VIKEEGGTEGEVGEGTDAGGHAHGCDIGCALESGDGVRFIAVEEALAAAAELGLLLAVKFRGELREELPAACTRFRY
jgi:hypothetical protein